MTVRHKRFKGCGRHGFADDGLERWRSDCPSCNPPPASAIPESPAQKIARKLARAERRPR